ncbi:MAG: phosphoribosyltransferase family protein, partial [Bdellovibrionia bacterium]
TGKHVLIVEEIIDEAKTLSFLKSRLMAANPASLKIITLLDKPARRVVNLKPDFIGKTIEDRFVVGYGLDEGEIGRNYPDIYYLKH